MVKKMIRRYLGNRKRHACRFSGIRSLSKQDPDYNNENIIVPFSNWQGPVWLIANYFYFVGLKNYGMEKGVPATGLYPWNYDIPRHLQLLFNARELSCRYWATPLTDSRTIQRRCFHWLCRLEPFVQNMFMGIVEDDWLLLEIELKRSLSRRKYNLWCLRAGMIAGSVGNSAVTALLGM